MDDGFYRGDSPRPKVSGWRRFWKASSPPPASVDRRAAGRPLTADDVRRTAFTSTKLREGYDMAEVDALLDQVEQHLRLRSQGRPGSLTSEAVINCRFAASKFRAGYDQEEVDDFLDRVVAELLRER